MAALKRAGWVLAAATALVVLPGCKSNPGSVLGPVRKALGEAPAAGVEMFALRVGTSPGAPRDYFIADPEMPGRIQVAFSFWALKTEERLILIDCGFVDPGRAERWGIADWRGPAALLAEAGLSSASVTDVVLTHGHWDHVGGLGSFPTARVWVDPKELASATAEALQAEPALGRVLAKLAHQPRLRSLEAVAAIAPGVVAFPSRLHAPGAWVVAVRAANGVWVFASDEVPLYRNLERRIPSGQTSDPGRSKILFDRLLELTGGLAERIVPGHDPAVYQRFPGVTDRVVRLSP